MSETVTQDIKVGDKILLHHGAVRQVENDGGGENTWIGARAVVEEVITDTLSNLLMGERVFYLFQIEEDDREGRLRFGHTDENEDEDGYDYQDKNEWKGIAYPDEVTLL